MSFNDIFKGDFFNNITAIAPIDMAVALGLAVIIGIFIMEVYKKTFCGVMYSKSFGTSLLAMTILTTFIILKDLGTNFVNKIGKIEGVINAVLVSYNGDYMG